MKKLFCFIALCLLAFQIQAQFNLRLIVTSAATRQNEDVYVSGNFNNWEPKDEKYKLKPFAGGRKSIVLKDLQAGVYAFKFTRGGLDKIETTEDGRDIENHVIEINADASSEYKIAGWKDDYPVKPKPYTASPQVRTVDTAFNMPLLRTKKKIWVYLPKTYASSNKTYPVLYMHDGQNLFNEQTAPFGEWGIDECLDSLQKISGKEAIIIGISNGSKRMNEYNTNDHVQFGKGEGKAYIDDIVKTLKPFIDTKYRTKKGVEYTAIAGSSMGGLISFQALLQYPEVFGSAGVFSPSFWVSPVEFVNAEKFAVTRQSKFYFYAGGKESGNMVVDMKKMAEILQKKPQYIIRSVYSPLGEHNEATWRKEFPGFYLWWLQ